MKKLLTDLVVSLDGYVVSSTCSNCFSQKDTLDFQKK